MIGFQLVSADEQSTWPLEKALHSWYDRLNADGYECLCMRMRKIQGRSLALRRCLNDTQKHQGREYKAILSVCMLAKTMYYIS